MAHSFIALIDESGDDGLEKFRETGSRGGASKWLVISSCIFRASRDLEAVKWRDEILQFMPDRKKRMLHFAELNHGQRLAAARYLSNKPVRAINVISNKTCLQKDVFTEKNQLYFYLTRYLIERVSWLCRDMRPQVPEGDGRVKIIFSRRGGLSYDNFKEYMTHLASTIDSEVRIHWPVIDIEAIEARDHSKSASLQIADIVASSFASAFEQDRYGNSEWRYAELLRRIVYNRKDNFLSYGMKFHPSLKNLQLSNEQKRAIGVFERDGRPPGP